MAITSNISDYSKPEEIAHFSFMKFNHKGAGLMDQNLQNSALRIEKKDNHFRFLFAYGMYQNFAYKEIFNKDIDIQPRYAAVFAIKGFSKSSNTVPVHVKFFSLNNLPCN